jgi:hypothetical protein
MLMDTVLLSHMIGSTKHTNLAMYAQGQGRPHPGDRGSNVLRRDVIRSMPIWRPRQAAPSTRQLRCRKNRRSNWLRRSLGRRPYLPVAVYPVMAGQCCGRMPSGKLTCLLCVRWLKGQGRGSATFLEHCLACLD